METESTEIETSSEFSIELKEAAIKAVVVSVIAVAIKELAPYLTKKAVKKIKKIKLERALAKAAVES